MTVPVILFTLKISCLLDLVQQRERMLYIDFCASRLDLFPTVIKVYEHAQPTN